MYACAHGRRGRCKLSHVQKWLARLAFSFFIVGAALAWEGYRSYGGRGVPIDRTRASLMFAGAAMCAVLGGAGVRARHRPPGA